MGSEVIARCDCGVEASIAIGGGMLSFKTICCFPCLCDACHSVVEVNLLSKSLRCPQCRAPDPIPYDDPRLSGSPGSRKVAEWKMQDQLGRDLVLWDGKYRCPKCGKMSMQFSNSGVCWD